MHISADVLLPEYYHVTVFDNEHDYFTKETNLSAQNCDPLMKTSLQTDEACPLSSGEMESTPTAVPISTVLDIGELLNYSTTNIVLWVISALTEAQYYHLLEHHYVSPVDCAYLNVFAWM